MEKPIIYHCRDCNMRKDIDNCEDITTSTGSCPCCGSRNWVMIDKKFGAVIA